MDMVKPWQPNPDHHLTTLRGHEYHPNPPWDEREWAVYHDYVAQTWQAIERMMATPRKKVQEYRQAEIEFAQALTKIRTEHPRLRLRGTVMLRLE